MSSPGGKPNGRPSCGGSVEQPGELLTGLGGLVGRLLTTRSDMPQRRSRCHAYSVGYAADRHPMLINR